MRTWANIEDPDDNTAFHQGIHYLSPVKDLKKKYLEIIPVTNRYIQCTFLSLLQKPEGRIH